jgi:hypothetical protein
MPTDYELTFEQRTGYLYAHVRAVTIDERISEAYQKEIAAKCDELTIQKLMIYRDIPNALSTTSAYFAANRLLKLLPNIRIAFVNPYESNEKNLQFATTVGSNFGEQHKVFNDGTKAERWLLSR